MDRNVFVAIALSMSVLLFWGAYAQKHDVLLPLMEKSFSKLKK